MVESFLKGGMLLFAKDSIIRSCQGLGFGSVTSGLLGGFGGTFTAAHTLHSSSLNINLLLVLNVNTNNTYIITTNFYW